jgi:hypothetical protein
MYRIRSAKLRPEFKGLWDGPAWQQADTVELAHFRPESSNHRPRTSARILYNDEGIFGIFHVEDRYVRCVNTWYGDPVCKDSCVEFFVRPKGDKGYFNFEFNCGGAMLCSYITDWKRTAVGFKEFVPIPEDEGRAVGLYHSMPEVVDPEIIDPVIWTLEFLIPFNLLKKYVGQLGNISGQEWGANFYKCGDETSHPHWASWQPVPKLNFHLPECFGVVRFESD